MRIKNRPIVNIIIDVIILILMASVSGIGFIMAYIIPSNYAIRHSGVQPYVQNVCGMGRHEWGDLHLILSIILLILLVLHVVLHGKLITSIFCKMIPNHMLRMGVYVAILFITIFFMFAPFLYML
ncbi:MAG: DUF4405 domain-containing protein [Rikenellaceae bacterium]